MKIKKKISDSNMCKQKDLNGNNSDEIRFRMIRVKRRLLFKGARSIRRRTISCNNIIKLQRVCILPFIKKFIKFNMKKK